jgi:GntR family transcriptional repressor for pyruvate dehydrogenase complex
MEGSAPAALGSAMAYTGPASDKVAWIERELRARIASGAWETGSRLPSERQLAGEFGVARNTLRKALAALSQAGLLTAGIGRGTFVAGSVPPALVEALRRAARPVAPSDAAEVRLLLEPPAAALAATRATAADYAAIEAALHAGLAADSYEAFERADAGLHAAIIAASRNTFLVDLYSIIVATRDEPRWTALKRRAATPQRRALYDRQHTALVQALRERDVDAAFRAMQEHLREVQASLSDYRPSPAGAQEP